MEFWFLGVHTSWKWDQYRKTHSDVIYSVLVEAKMALYSFDP